MSYPSGGDRRKGDRRVFNDPNYTGPERRVADRRRPQKEPRSKLGLAIGAFAVFVVADTAFWDGHYRHVALASFHAETGQMREWGAHIWDLG